MASAYASLTFYLRNDLTDYLSPHDVILMTSRGLTNTFFVQPFFQCSTFKKKYNKIYIIKITFVLFSGESYYFLNFEIDPVVVAERG